MEATWEGIAYASPLAGEKKMYLFHVIEWKRTREGSKTLITNSASVVDERHIAIGYKGTNPINGLNMLTEYSSLYKACYDRSEERGIAVEFRLLGITTCPDFEGKLAEDLSVEFIGKEEISRLKERLEEIKAKERAVA